MKILVVGYSGFIGARLTRTLLAAGHHVVCAGRRAARVPTHSRATFAEHDLARDTNAADWLAALAGVDVVVNAAGAIADRRGGDLERVHSDGPRALFDACVTAHVRRVIQISALGADGNADTRFHKTKLAADEHLRRLPIESVVVRPSLVFGRGGASGALFAALASAPLTPLPGAGEQRIQPIHVDDAVAALVRLVESDSCPATLDLVGREPLTLRDYLAELRKSLGLSAPRFVAVPLGLVRAAASVGTRVGRGILNSETLAMLLRGNVADAAPLARWLGRPPRHAAEFFDAATRALDRREASWTWIRLTFIVSIAVMWLVSGIVSLGLYPVEASLATLAEVGITSRPLANVALYGAATLDIALGVATLVASRRRALWAAQIAVVLVYTAILTARLPELWLEPFGPVLKNLPVLAMLACLYVLEER